MLLNNFVKPIISQYRDLFGFNAEFLGHQKIVLGNMYFKIIFVDQRYDIDVFVSDKSELHKVHIESLVEFLHPRLKALPEHAGGLNFDILIREYLTDIWLTASFNWAELMSFENLKRETRQFIIGNYPPGHELSYLMNSGLQCLQVKPRAGVERTEQGDIIV